MNAVIYYSNTLESYKIANYISQKTNYPLIDFHKLNNYSFDNIFIVFPVHYQNIPQSIKPIIKRIHASKAVIIATYGKMSFGNVLFETQKLLGAKMVGGAYIPTKHPYIEDDKSFDSKYEVKVLPTVATHSTVKSHAPEDTKNADSKTEIDDIEPQQ